MDGEIIYGVIGLIIAYSYIWYTVLIKRRNAAESSFRTIDVYLKQRAELVVNVIKLAKKYMDHEKDLLTELTQIRMSNSSAAKVCSQDVEQQIKSDNHMKKALVDFFAVAENYPELKSVETLVEAQKTYKSTEQDLAAARRNYNAHVINLKNPLETFPTSIIGKIANVQILPYWEVSDDERKILKQAPNTDDLMAG